MRVTVVIATCGDEAWSELAWSRAYPSANRVRIGDPKVWTTEIILRHLTDGTVVEARNAAAHDATGDWLCFLDADDELAPGYLDAMAKAERRKLTHDPETLERVEDGLLVPAVQFVEAGWDHVAPLAPAEIPNGGGSRPLIDINHAVIGTLVPRRLFLEVGGFRELAALEDWDLWLRCEEEGALLVPVPEAVYRAWVRAQSRNHDQSLYTSLRGEAIRRRAARKGESNDRAAGGAGSRPHLHE